MKRLIVILTLLFTVLCMPSPAQSQDSTYLKMEQINAHRMNAILSLFVTAGGIAGTIVSMSNFNDCKDNIDAIDTIVEFTGPSEFFKSERQDWEDKKRTYRIFAVSSAMITVASLLIFKSELNWMNKLQHEVYLDNHQAKLKLSIPLG